MICNILLDEYEVIYNQLKKNIQELQNKSFLITGATGLIGSYLTNFLIYLNDAYSFNTKIYTVARSKEKLIEKFNNQTYPIEQDLNLPFEFDFDVDYIIHAASNSHPLAFSTNPVGTMKTNIIGTINLLEFATRTNSKFLYLSTGEIYGNNIDNDFSEDDLGLVDTKLARSCYPESKRAAETLCAAYKEQYSINTNVARLCYVYGATITDENSRADAQFLRNAINNQNIVLKSEGKQKRTYCYVADAVCGLLHIILNGNNGEVYNIANNNSIISIKEYAENLAEISNVKVVYELPDEIEKKGYSQPLNSILDGTKLTKLGWKPVYNIKEGIKHTYLIKKEQECSQN